MTSSLPRVAVIGTGGTISSFAQSSLDSIDYPDFGRKLAVDEILDRFEETRRVADPLPTVAPARCQMINSKLRMADGAPISRS